jgi:hydrogenase nickel incorporation protein HypB
MCTTCGCGDPELVPVELHERILAGNDRTARHNREHFAAHGLLAVNLMGSPGAGKTAVLEATATAAAPRGWGLAAVSADLATDNDARRLQGAGIPSRAITTGQACHLDAELVHRALHGFDLGGAGILFIENVGNLVCPAIYDLGQRANVVVLSIAEGEDKPLKYPVMFKAADLVLVTKLDLAPVLGVDLALLEANLARVMPRPRAIRLSARSGEGMAEWIAWLAEQKAAVEREASTAAAPATHRHGPLPEHGDGLPHPHEHTHAHRHGALTHSHPHAHTHVHAVGAYDGPERAHAHEGGADHDHEHAAEGRLRSAKRKPGRAGARPVLAKSTSGKKGGSVRKKASAPRPKKPSGARRRSRR